MFDVGVGLILLAPAAVLSAILLAAIALESPGNPLFVQTRVGRRGALFRLLKLRTLRSGTPHLPSHEVGLGNITRLGRLLRRTKLDELPQVWNVLTGDMSFVGPRPCLPSQVRLIERRKATGADAVRPGITGPAQLAGIDMSEPDRLAEIDGIYAASATLGGDIRIMLRTVSGGGAGDAAR